MRLSYRTESYAFDGTLPGYDHGEPIRIVIHRQGNPGARALASLAWGDREDRYTIHSYIDRDGVAIDALPPTTHAYHVREFRKALEMGVPVRQVGWRKWALSRRGDVQTIGIETVDLGSADAYYLSQETRITLLLRTADYIREFPAIDPMMHVHEHAQLDPWTRAHDLGDALNMIDFRLDLEDVLAGEEPWRTVGELATGARAPAVRPATPNARWLAMGRIAAAEAELNRAKHLLATD